MMIIDVFSGQMINLVTENLKGNNMKLTRVPVNMTNLFQPLELTINGFAKIFLKKKFAELYGSLISKQLEEEKSIEDINIVLKPLHAKWINEFYDYMASEESCKIISNHWKATFITEAIEQGTKDLEPLNMFFDIDSLIKEDNQTIVETLAYQDEIDFFAVRFMNDESNYKDEWKFEGTPLPYLTL